jgi:hypothetical protein
MWIMLVVDSHLRYAPSLDGGSMWIMLAMGSLLALCEMGRGN